MDPQVLTVVITAIVTLAAAGIGPALQRDSRRAAIQEAELLGKVPEGSEAYEDLVAILNRRIERWRMGPYATAALASMLAMIAGAGLLALLLGVDPLLLLRLYAMGLIGAGIAQLVFTLVRRKRDFS